MFFICYLYVAKQLFQHNLNMFEICLNHWKVFFSLLNIGHLHRQVIPVGSSTGTILAARCWLPKSFLLESVQGPNTHTSSNHLWAADQRVRGLALDQLQFKLPRVHLRRGQLTKWSLII